MPQARHVKRIVNALCSQERVMYHLNGCSHVVSVTLREIREGRGSLESYLKADEVMCPFCPDLPPPTPEDVRRAKSATQLWREAGQP